MSSVFIDKYHAFCTVVDMNVI